MVNTAPNMKEFANQRLTFDGLEGQWGITSCQLDISMGEPARLRLECICVGGKPDWSKQLESVPENIRPVLEALYELDGRLPEGTNMVIDVEYDEAGEISFRPRIEAV
jgi:hypothetical protein